MKKIILALTAVVCLVTFAISQDKKAKAATPAVKATPAAKATPAVAAKPAAPAAKTKADGTPDMRYKENKGKAAAPAAGPLKKDGTPDKRFNANKEAPKKKG